ncbi:MAG: DUF3016 domain-containing protein [Pseudomonadota bacterium]
MKTVLKSLALSGLLLLSAGGASAGVTVTFANPDQFRDMPLSPSDRADMLKELTEHFERLGKDLPPGQDLRVEVLDMDLAGELRPNFRGHEIRILRGTADWPRMQVRYTLEANGQVVRRGEDALSDMTYLNRTPRYADSDTMRYEKRMIDEWFKEKFAAPKAARR